MTRNEAIDWLKAISFVSDPHITEAINMAIESLSADSVRFEVYRDIYVKYMNLKHKTEWIPVSERLPEVKEICLLTVHEYGWNCKDYTRVIIGEYSDNYADHILAWMPLPEPYRKDGEIEE